MRSSRLYLATRSLRQGAPVLIWPERVATARSAMVVSSVSPERWLMMFAQPWLFARSTAASVSLSVPIWLSLTSRALLTPSAMPRADDLGVGDEDVVADQLDAGRRARGSAVFQPAQSPSARPSSIDTSG